jgi:hypothetical protein
VGRSWSGEALEANIVRFFVFAGPHDFLSKPLSSGRRPHAGLRAEAGRIVALASLLGVKPAEPIKRPISESQVRHWLPLVAITAYSRMHYLSAIIPGIKSICRRFYWYLS